MPALPTFDTITLLVDAGVAHLTLSRPQSRNALNRQLLGELREALALVANEKEARVLLLTGAGRSFSSGADLSSGGSPAGGDKFDAGRVLEDFYNPLIEDMRDLPVPIVAGVQGAVAGAGCMIALSADIVVAARSAFFLQAFINVGLVPDAGSMWLLPRLIGPARAQAMMLLGERLPAEKACDWGMIYEVVDDDGLADRAQAIATRLATGPTRAYRLIRSGVRSAMETTLSEALGMEREAQREAGESTDFKEGVAAFREKRKPRFTGD